VAKKLTGARATMAHKWQDRIEFPIRTGAPAVVLEDEEARTLEWAEIAGLIEIRADGSWEPTAFGRAQLLKLMSGEDGKSRSH
jgi:hypothetical protein